MEYNTNRTIKLREKINKRWRHNLFIICVLMAAIGSVAEIVIYLIDSQTKTLFLPNNLYRLRFIYIPSGLNIIVIFSTWFHLRSEKLTDNVKNIWSCILIYFLCANTQFIHYVYGPLLMLPIISIFFSVIFANHKLTRAITIASLCSLTAATYVSAHELRKGDPQMVADTGLAALVILVAQVGASLMIAYVEEQFQSIASSNNREKMLIQELHLDSLMGIYNRMALNEKLISCIANDYEPNQTQLLILDIDDFKYVNDSYGHLCGDDVLIKLSDTIRGFTSRNVNAYRYGGEEIVIIFQHFTLDAACELAEELRTTFSSIAYDFSKTERITFSGGIATLQKGQNPDSWIKAADEALYQAKSSGKNNITRAS